MAAGEERSRDGPVELRDLLLRAEREQHVTVREEACRTGAAPRRWRAIGWRFDTTLEARRLPGSVSSRCHVSSRCNVDLMRGNACVTSRQDRCYTMQRFTAGTALADEVT
jgi:hypothetical protein